MIGSEGPPCKSDGDQREGGIAERRPVQLGHPGEKIVRYDVDGIVRKDERVFNHEAAR